MVAAPELVGYLRSELGRGVAEEQLRAVLLQRGYAQAVIDEGFAAVRGVQQAGQPQPAAQPASGGRVNRSALAGFIVVLVPVVLNLVLFVIPVVSLEGAITRSLVRVVGGLLCSIAGLVLGIIGMRRCKRSGDRGRVLAILAIVFGALGLIGYLILMAGLLFMRGLVDDASGTLGSALSGVDVGGGIVDVVLTTPLDHEAVCRNETDEWCIMNVAIYNDDASLCDRLSDVDFKATCSSVIAQGEQVFREHDFILYCGVHGDILGERCRQACEDEGLVFSLSEEPLSLNGMNRCDLQEKTGLTIVSCHCY